jgi:hypothetical protein
MNECEKDEERITNHKDEVLLVLKWEPLKTMQNANQKAGGARVISMKNLLLDMCVDSILYFLNEYFS